MTDEAATIPSRYRQDTGKSLLGRLNLPIFMTENQKQRRERGRRENKRVRRSDAVLFSPGNSGRTWLRVMLTRLIEVHYGLTDLPIINYNNGHKLDSRVLKLAVTHNRWLPYYRIPRLGRECEPYYGSRVLLLVRNPLDTCISQYYQWLHRSNDKNVHLKGWPDRSSELSLQEFLNDERTGILRLCQELNIWVQEMPKFAASHIVRYEDLKTHTEQELGGIARFLCIDADPKATSDAVEFARFENMQKRESEQSADTKARHNYRMSVSNNNGLKARKGLIAGYSRYLSEAESERYQTMITNSLDHTLGYSNLPKIRPTSFPGRASN